MIHDHKTSEKRVELKKTKFSGATSVYLSKYLRAEIKKQDITEIPIWNATDGYPP
jgi:hypothetical protein